MLLKVRAAAAVFLENMKERLFACRHCSIFTSRSSSSFGWRQYRMQAGTLSERGCCFVGFFFWHPWQTSSVSTFPTTSHLLSCRDLHNQRETKWFLQSSLKWQWAGKTSLEGRNLKQAPNSGRKTSLSHTKFQIVFFFIVSASASQPVARSNTCVFSCLKLAQNVRVVRCLVCKHLHFSVGYLPWL